MPNVFNLKSKIILTFRNNIQRVAFEGVMLTLILILVLIILLSNVFRVIQSGQNNYKVFRYEKDSLTELKAKNEILRFELEATSTDEYKRLLAREVLGLAKDSEDLFKTQEDANFYQSKIILYDVKDKTNYSDWWGMLVN